MSLYKGLLVFIASLIFFFSTDVMGMTNSKLGQDDYVASFYSDAETPSLIPIPEQLIKRRILKNGENNYLLRFGRSNERPGDLERFLQMDVQIPLFRFG
uniref:Uncharacterized protein n=1 Tax=Strongyloides papillosus TaxID=174720 RepID=A0A0N5BEM2_STREA